MIIFNNKDFKYNNWAAEISSLGQSAIATEKLYPFILIILVKNILSGQNVKSFIFRYLNDRKSFFNTILNFITDIIIIFICKINNIRIIWIAHNVDKESFIYYRKINFYRRRMISYFSDKIFVTDPLLIDYTDEYKINKLKVDWISLGVPNDKSIDDRNKKLLNEIINFKIKLNKKYKEKKIILGFCATGTSIKNYHFLFANDLVNQNLNSKKSCIGLVLIGKFPENDRFQIEKKRVLGNEDILYIKENFPVNEIFLSSEIDFLYRTLNDLSVPYSVYVSALIKKPILTDNYGFFPTMVEKYKLGGIVPSLNTQKPDWICDIIDNWNPDFATKFLENRTWAKGAKKIIKASSEI